MSSPAHELGATVGQWNALIRRARMTPKQKLAALLLSSYADADGTGIHSGVARLSVDLEVGYSTAKRYLAWLRQVGLVEVVRAGNRRRRRSDEYRLILGPDVLEHLEVLDPTRYQAMIDGVRDTNRGPRDPDQGSSKASPDAPDEPVDNTDQGSPNVSPDAPVDNSDHGSPMVSPERSIRAHSGVDQGSLMSEPPPPLSTSPTRSTSPTTETADLRTAVTLSPATADPRTAGAPPRCDHGLSAAPRGDGRPSCAICRVEQDRADGVRRFTPARPAHPQPPGWIAPVIDLQTRETS